MIFKNLNIFRVTGSVTQKALDEFLSRQPFEPCLPHEESASGFMPVFGLDSRVFSANGCHLFCLKVDEKVIPPSAVKALYRQLSDERSSFLGRKLSTSEREDLRAQAKRELCSAAFCRPADLWAYLDMRAGLLVVNTTSAKVADALAQRVKGSMPGHDIVPLPPAGDIRLTMTDWLKAGMATDPLILGHKCEITDGEGTIRYKDRLLSDSMLQSYLKDGMQAQTLSLEVQDRCSFVLTADFLLKEFVLDKQLSADARAQVADSLETTGNELSEMSTLIRELLEMLQKSFKNISHF